MVATMRVTPAIVPLRWIGRGVDVRVCITDEILVYGFDALAALGIFTDTINRHRSYPLAAVGLLPAGVKFRDDVVDESRSSTPLYTIDRLEQIAQRNHTDPNLVDELFAWLRAAVDALLNPPPAQPSTEVAEDPGAEPATYSLRRAAVILSRDPALTYGQQTLLDAISALGWTARELGIWVPAPKPLDEGWLVRHRIRVGYERREERVLCPQIRITQAGLQELHTRLGGVSTLAIDEQPAPTLLDPA